MPDIRTTPIVDTFDYDEAPISNGGKWVKWGTGLAESVSTPPGTFNPLGSGDSLYYWNPISVDGDMEVWGRLYGAADVSEGWRIGMVTTGGLSGGGTGYQLLLTRAIGNLTQYWLRKYTGGGGFTTLEIGSGAPTFPGEYCLFRRRGSVLEGWKSSDDGSTWTMFVSYSDGTYMTGMHPAIGMSSDDGTQESWQSFGSGIRKPWIPQIYRRPNE
jgi:hypothetical protein